MNPEINRGERAKQVIDNKLFKEAFTMLKAELYNGFINTKFKDSDERDEIWRKQQAVDYVESYLTEVMETGEIARKGLLQKIKRVV